MMLDFIVTSQWPFNDFTLRRTHIKRKYNKKKVYTQNGGSEEYVTYERVGGTADKGNIT